MTTSKLAVILYYATWALIVLLPVGLAGALVLSGPMSGMTSVSSSISASANVSQTQLWLATLAGLAGVGAFIWVLVQMQSLFDLYRHGHSLTIDAANAIRRIGLGLLAMGLLPLLIIPIQSVLLTWNNPEGERQLSVGASSTDLGLLLGGGLLLLIGWAMRDAADIAAENRSFV